MVTKAASAKAVENTEPVEDAVVDEVQETKPEPKEETITPRDTVDALRLIRKMKLIEPDDDNETRMHIRNVVVTWISQKRAGTTNQDFDTWYTTPDLNDAADDAAEGSEDPT